LKKSDGSPAVSSFMKRARGSIEYATSRPGSDLEEKHVLDIKSKGKIKR
jgi:hypothetical protein